MNVIKRMLGGLSELGGTIMACITGVVAGITTVHVIDAVIVFTVTSLGVGPILGVAGAIIGLAIGICYALIYLCVAFSVMRRVEEYISQCRANAKFRRVYVVA
jgi:hypothetical protein